VSVTGLVRRGTPDRRYPVMIVGFRRAGGSVRGWELWSLPATARRVLLLVELSAAAVVLVLLAVTPTNGGDLVRVAVLGGLGGLYLEVTSRVERLKRYLGYDAVFAENLSVWAVAAVLTVPAGWAAVLVAALHTQVLYHRRRERSGHPYRVVYSAAALVLAVLAAAGILHAVGGGAAALRGGILGPLTVVGALLVFTAVNLTVVLGGVWVSARPPSVRVLLPDSDAVGYEFATLVLGAVTGLVLTHVPALTPLVLLLVAYLHRSSLVNALHRNARTDTKTGLLTLTAWTDHAHGVLHRADRDHQPVTVLFCDLDHFKTINDRHGHLVGDQVLAAAADCLRREFRGYDGIGRFGGEEFVAVLDGLTPTQATTLADRLRTAVSTMHFPQDLAVTMSIGLAHHTPEEHTSQEPRATLADLLARSDAALRRAKTTGRDRVHTA